MQLTSFEPSRFTQSSLFRATSNRCEYLVKSYLGPRADLRRDLEARKLRHWAALGFSVPAVFDIEVTQLKQPYLVMGYIESVTLKQFLQQPECQPQEQTSLLASVFECNARRHRLALNTNDSLLIHTDPNTDNILVTDQLFFHVDFEHPARETSITLAVAQEIATFARRVASHMDREQLPETVASLWSAYDHDQRLFGQIVALTRGRPLQVLHRFRDRRRKRAAPLLVTRYDIADAISKLL
jgi:tRNA A-37 threonylcarbamoyl transferase component Bud32